MLRRWLHTQVLDILPDNLITDAKIMAAGIWGTEVIVGGVKVDTTPDPPFIISRGGVYVPRGAGVGRSQRFQLWVHDRPGSYVTHIEPFLLSLADQLPGRAGVYFNGWYISACEFEGTSEDLSDPDKDTAMRYGVFRITGRQVGSA